MAQALYGGSSDALVHENEALKDELRSLMARREQIELQMAASREEASRQVLLHNNHKQTLAGEVFKLREEKAKLDKATAGPIANSHGMVATNDPVRAETISILKQHMVEAQEEKEKMMQIGHKEKVLQAKQIKILREEVADAANDETRLRAAVDSSSGALSAPAGASERVRTKAAIDEKESLDRLFLEQVSEMRQNLRASTLNRLAQSNQQLTIHQLIAISNDQIHRTVSQASNIKADKLLHKEFVALLHENGSIRRTLNEYAESLLRDPSLGSTKSAMDRQPYLAREDGTGTAASKLGTNGAHRTCGGLFA